MTEKYCCSCMKLIDENAEKCPECGYDVSEYSAEPHQLSPGTLLNNRYILGKVLGEGGFGITYVGTDTVLDLKVAVKEFYMSGYVNRNCTSSSTVYVSSGTNTQIFEKNREKFLDEARTLAKFSKEDGIVGIRDYFIENNTAYIVMDFLEGDTLKSYIKSRKKISWNEIMEIIRPVLNSMEQIHKKNIIHRDISPDNIMLTDDGKVKLLDFGAAREFSQDNVKSLSVILKPGYAPEEQYRSKGQQGPWTDVYAICATIYRCITGKVPDEAMERLIDDSVVPPLEAGADCTPAQSAVLMKGLAVMKKNRYSSITEFLADVKKAEEDPDNANIPGNAEGSASSQTILISENNADTSAKEIPEKKADAQKVPDPEPPSVTEISPEHTTLTVNKESYKLPDAAPDRSAEPVPVPDKTQDNAPAKTKKKIPKLIKRLIPVFIVLFLIVDIVLPLLKIEDFSLSDKENQYIYAGGKLPLNMSSLSFRINGEKYRIPETFSHFEKNGWVPADGSDLSKKMEPNSYTPSPVILTNGYSDISVVFTNRSQDTLAQKDCLITYVRIFDDSIDHSKDKIEFSNNEEIGEPRKTNILLNWKKCDFSVKVSKDNVKTTKLSFYESDNGKPADEDDRIKSYNFIFSDDILDQVIIEDNSKNIISSSVSDEMQDIDIEQHKNNDYGKWVYSKYGVEMPAICTLEKFTGSGWTIENRPDSVASHKTENVEIRYDALTTMDICLYNPSDKAVPPEKALISLYSIRSSDQKRSGSWTLENGSIKFSQGTDTTVIIKALNENSIKYTYKDNTLKIYSIDDLPYITVTMKNGTANLCDFDYRRMLKEVFK